jgi:nucleoid-associated protein EbfC
MGSGFAKKKKQAKAMQSQLSQMQSSIQNAEAIGTAGNGLVTVTLSGDHEVKKIKIKPECVDAEDIEGLEDLIKAAFNDASKKMQESSMQQMTSKMPGGMPNIPGLGNFGI